MVEILVAGAAIGSCTPSNDGACIVAWLDERPLNLGEALASTARQLPPPSRSERLRLAVDVEVAARERGATTATSSDRMDAYRAWLLDAGGRREDWGAVAGAMQGARERHGFRPGPCYPQP